MNRFVLVATMLRGAVEPPEPVDSETEALMLEQQRTERAWEDVRVLWNRGAEPKRPQSKEDRKHVRHMMELAARARVA
jgi:hypothetical protein